MKKQLILVLWLMYYLMLEQFITGVGSDYNNFESNEELQSVRITNDESMSLRLREIILWLDVNKELLSSQCCNGSNTKMWKVSSAPLIIKQDINHHGLTVHCFCHYLSFPCGYQILQINEKKI